MTTEVPLPPSSGADGTLKPFSCSGCRQRKLRCDRALPCRHCVRAETACEYVLPIRGKRQKTKPRREGLHAKVRRYEEMLRTRGVGVDAEVTTTGSVSGVTMSGASTAVSPVSYMVPEPMGLRSLVMETPGSTSKLVSEEGSSRYYDTPGSSIGDEFRHPNEFARARDAEDNGEPDVALLLGSSPSGGSLAGQISDYHPSLPCLHSLRQVFIERIDPLVKIMHMPSFWASTLEVAQGRSEPRRSVEAAIFCFYAASISVLEEEECQKMFKECKMAVFGRYRAVARHALGRAGLLSTSSPTTLRAFFLFMMALRGHLRHDSQYILCGIALRLAQKMGLHRDGKCLGLSLFDTEMRRRLWWHAVHLDFRTADLLGTRPSLDLNVGDAGTPWNVEDEDLDPDMTEPPKERKAITPMTMCLVRCNLSQYLRQLTGNSHGGASWGTICSESNLKTAEKASFIDGIEDELEMRYVRYCDPSRSLDMLVSCMIRASVCNMRLSVHNPRRFGSFPEQAFEADRKIAFRNAVKLLEYASLVGENKSLQRYEWRINTTYLWDKILYVLIEARHQRLGPDVDRLWDLIGRLFDQHPHAFGEASATAAVYSALSKWTPEVWDGYVAARRKEGLMEVDEPGYIGTMRRWQDAREDTANETTSRPVQEQDIPQVEGMDAGDRFSNLESFELNVDEAGSWEQLISEQNGFHFVPGY